MRPIVSAITSTCSMQTKEADKTHYHMKSRY